MVKLDTCAPCSSLSFGIPGGGEIIPQQKCPLANPPPNPLWPLMLSPVRNHTSFQNLCVLGSDFMFLMQIHFCLDGYVNIVGTTRAAPKMRLSSALPWAEGPAPFGTEDGGHSLNGFDILQSMPRGQGVSGVVLWSSRKAGSMPVKLFARSGKEVGVQGSGLRNSVFESPA